MKHDDKYVECLCGKKVTAPAEGLNEGAKCPSCGALLSGSEEKCGISLGDTQMVNIHEMAQMAQDGVEVGISGEWDTRKHCTSKSDD